MAGAKRSIHRQLDGVQTGEDVGVERKTIRSAATDLQSTHLGAGILELGEHVCGTSWIGLHPVEHVACLSQRSGKSCHARTPPGLTTAGVELGERGLTFAERCIGRLKVRDIIHSGPGYQAE